MGLAAGRQRGWEYSISVTDPCKKAPVLRTVEEMELAAAEWTALDAEGRKQAMLVYCSEQRKALSLEPRIWRSSLDALEIGRRTTVAGGRAVKQAWCLISLIGQIVCMVTGRQWSLGHRNGWRTLGSSKQGDVGPLGLAGPLVRGCVKGRVNGPAVRYDRDACRCRQWV